METASRNGKRTVDMGTGGSYFSFYTHTHKQELIDRGRSDKVL